MGKLIFILLFGLALSIFVAENTGPVVIHFLFWQSRAMSLSLLVVLTVVFSALTTLLVIWPRHYKTRRELARHKKELEALRESDS